MEKRTVDAKIMEENVVDASGPPQNHPGRLPSMVRKSSSHCGRRNGG